MVSLKKRAQAGFTIVELLIVIVVIGILAALVLNSFQGVQARARDTERRTDQNSVATQLEVYYNDKSSYPTTADVASDTWIAANLKGADTQAFRAPGQTANSVTNSATPTKNQYGYVTTPAGTGCQSPTDNTGAAATVTTSCTKFTLYYLEEQGNSVKSKGSLN